MGNGDIDSNPPFSRVRPGVCGVLDDFQKHDKLKHPYKASVIVRK
jgi:hypothetical protein